MNDNVNKLVNAAGVVAEMCRITYAAMRRAGFTKRDALALTETYFLHLLETSDNTSNPADPPAEQK